MQFELEGKLIEKFDTREISERFRKREFVVETEENNGGRVFTEQIKFQLTQDKCEIIDQYKVNDQIKVSFNIKGRKWEKNGKVNYFTNLEAWRLEAVGSGAQRAPDMPPPPAEEPGFEPADTGNGFNEEEDDLPF